MQKCKNEGMLSNIQSYINEHQKGDIFIVLHQSYMPSVLIETGFLTNRNEGAYLNSKKGQNEMASSIADAIISYQKNLSLATSDAQNPIITQDEIDKAIETTDERIYEGIV